MKRLFILLPLALALSSCSTVVLQEATENIEDTEELTQDGKRPQYKHHPTHKLSVA